MSRILIAEDEARISSFIEKGLRASGLTTTVVESGVQALALARSGEFDLMILDIGLPELDGFAVLHALRSGSVDLPVLILTARDGIDDTVAGLRGGADDYMSKPFHFDELLARVQRRLGNPSRSVGANILSHNGISLGPAHQAAALRWQRQRPHRPRVHAAPDLPDPSRTGPLPRAAPQPRLGLRLRAWQQHRRNLHSVFAQKAWP